MDTRTHTLNLLDFIITLMLRDIKTNLLNHALQLSHINSNINHITSWHFNDINKHASYRSEVHDFEDPDCKSQVDDHGDEEEENEKV